MKYPPTAIYRVKQDLCSLYANPLQKKNEFEHIINLYWYILVLTAQMNRKKIMR